MPLKYDDWDDQLSEAYSAEELADTLERALAPLELFLKTEKPGEVWYPPAGTKTQHGDEMLSLQEAFWLVEDVLKTLRRNKTEIT